MTSRREGLDALAARAEILLAGPAAAAAAGVLRFAAGLYRAQAAAARGLAGKTLSGRLDEDLPALRAGLEQITTYIGEHGPTRLAAAARAEGAGAGLEAFWHGERSGAGPTDFLARARLRPWVAELAARGVTPELGSGAGAEMTGRCGFCGGLAWIAARRPVGEGGDSTQRFLGCALCGQEQAIGRIACPACGEGEPEALPCFTSDRHPGVRIEACTTCKRYVKSLDLSVDGHVVPEVDDLASLSFDLWAREQGFGRIEPGLAGI